MTNHQKNINHNIWILVAFFAFLVVISGYVIPRLDQQFDLDYQKWGAFGDYFGGILNPIFGFLAFLLLLKTIWIQQETLRTQQQELSATREELEKSTKALELQNSTMILQSFEGTFFQLLKRHNEILGNIACPPLYLNPSEYLSHKIDKSITGLDAIKKILEFIKESNLRYNHDEVYIYQKSYDDCKEFFGPYFRNLYYIFKIIDENDNLNRNQKLKYANIARAQLSSFEVALLFYNGRSIEGQGIVKFIIEYRLLKHIDCELLPNQSNINDYTIYPKECYMDR